MTTDKREAPQDRSWIEMESIKEPMNPFPVAMFLLSLLIGAATVYLLFS